MLFLMFLIDFNILHFEAKQKAYLSRPSVVFYKNLLYKLSNFWKLPNILNVRFDGAVTREESTTSDVN